jgi:uncharacterized protein with ACT and thioredoxin-like domain
MELPEKEYRITIPLDCIKDLEIKKIVLNNLSGHDIITRILKSGNEEGQIQRGAITEAETRCMKYWALPMEKVALNN